ncbi:MAG TPA: porin family protein [Longimicrobiales bacterium]|nr:porin family protein [Longimicrobiales bacterium]
MRAHALRRFVPVALLAVLPAQAAAQSIGVAGGLNSGTVDFSSVPAGMDIGYATSYHIGTFLVMPVLPALSVVAEARYVDKGWTLSGTATHATAKSAFVEVPLVVKLAPPTLMAIKPHVFAGPVASMRVSCNVTGTVLNVSFDGSCAQAGLDTRQQDVGMLVGAGFDLNYVGWTLVVDLAYNHGLLNLSRNAGSSAHSRTFYLTAGAQIPFGW